jgi:hypothetical protein
MFDEHFAFFLWISGDPDNSMMECIVLDSQIEASGPEHDVGSACVFFARSEITPTKPSYRSEFRL